MICSAVELVTQTHTLFNLMSFITYNEIENFIKEDSFNYSERQFRSRKYKKNERRYQRRQKQEQRDRNYDV